MKTIDTVEQWFHKRGPRERIYLFILGLICIYSFSMIFFIRPEMKEKKQLQEKIIQLQTQQTSMQQDMAAIEEAVKNGNLLALIDQEKKLNSMVKTKEKIIQSLRPLRVSVEDVSKLTKTILMQQNLNVDLVNLKDFPPQPWPAAGAQEMPEVMQMVTSAIFQRDLQIEFHSNYFNTVDYLAQLEKLPWPLYWDSLTYTVLDYPKADIVIKLHVLTS